MTVRFKSQSEYQKSFGAPRSRSVSPQRCTPLPGLRPDHMGSSREAGSQRQKRLGQSGLAQSCSSLLSPSDAAHVHRAAPSAAASRSRSAHRRNPSLERRPPTPPPESRAESEFTAQPKTPSGPRPAAEPEPGRPGKPRKLHPSQPDSQPQPSRPLTSASDEQQLSANEVDQALRWRAGLKAGGQRTGGQRSEYHKQFSWRKHLPAASPLLTAERVLHSSNRSIPPFKTDWVSMETEYQRSFQGAAPPASPRLRKHLEHQRVPLFQKHMRNKKRREESQKKPRPHPDVPSPPHDDVTPPPPPQVHRGHRMLTEYQSRFRSPLYRIPEKGGAADGDAPQVKQLKQLRQEASLYRRRAWGINFSRDHLNQLQSEHNVLWEPSDATESSASTDTPTPTPRLTFDLCPDEDGSSSAPSVEALDLASHSSVSSKRSSVAGSEINNTNNKTRQRTNPQRSKSPPAERRTAWGDREEEEREQKQKEKEEEEEEENTDEEEGRLPTPRLKIRPVQRTHHDLTTPATGGAILVGKVKSGDEAASPLKQQRSGSAVSVAAAAAGGGGDATAELPVKRREAWSESLHPPTSGPSPDHKPSASKPIRMKEVPQPPQPPPPPPVAPPPLVPPPLHGFHGTLRHPDFQHNGELGLRFRELQCSGRGCGSDDDDRLSVMSLRSAASCSAASVVLERAQKRREHFWGKR